MGWRNRSPITEMFLAGWRLRALADRIMRTRSKPLFALLVSLLVGVAHGQVAPKTSGNKGVYRDGAGGPMDAILLKDYDPESSLIAPRTAISHAKFPVIDMH